MSRYSGRYYKGASKDLKAAKRAEAEKRQAKTEIEED
jgi:hypothetical protein